MKVWNQDGSERSIKYGWAGKLILDHDEIERQGLKAITKVLLGFGGTVVYWGFYGVERGCLWDGVYSFK